MNIRRPHRVTQYSAPTGFVVTTDGGTISIAYQGYDVDPYAGMPPEVAVAIEAAFDAYAGETAYRLAPLPVPVPGHTGNEVAEAAGAVCRPGPGGLRRLGARRRRAACVA